jgi:zinc protease
MPRRSSRLQPDLLTLAFSLALGVPMAHADDLSLPEIPYQKYVLPNGLTLVVHEDHKTPIVAVNVWYHVGSKNEKPGKTGFAHLFEHLMFNGSEHFNDDYFKVVEKIGATDLNGTTNHDRTNYFQNVPVSALDTILWMESDRMGHLVGVIDQPRLDEQRGVVQNEKRQGENEPYGQDFNFIEENTYPKGHPYSWTVIGSMEDLSAASLDDVKEWFKTYYGAANAVVVIAGDVKPDEVKRKVDHYFGDIPSGPPVARHDAWVAPRKGVHRQQTEDRVPQARLYKVWNTPQIGSAEDSRLDLLASVLATGKTSRLYKRLVYDDQIATDVNAFQYSREIGSLFVVQATARPGGDLAAVERAVDQELARLIAEGPTPDEVQRARTQDFARFVRGVERIGGFGGKSDVLAQSLVFLGSPDAYRKRYEYVRSATATDLKEVAKTWLSDGVYVLEVHPFPEYQAATTGADRSKLPDTGVPPTARFATFQRATLSNGLKLVVAERHAVPVVSFDLLVDAGFASDQMATPGTAKLAGNLMDEGTKTKTALEISDALAGLGARLDTGSSIDTTTVSLSALKAKLDASLELLADVVQNPSFPQANFDRQKKQQLAEIQQEGVEPFSLALRVLPRLIYGEKHAYGTPLTGSGTAASVAKLTREEIARFHSTWFKPGNATLVVVGDTTLAEIQPRIERLFATWKGGEVPKKNVGPAPARTAAAVYILDRPGALQSVILAGAATPPRNNPEEVAIEAMNKVLGGQFSSRLNLNLREDKHWSYGAGSFFFGARGERPFVAYAPVQTDKTKESLVEVAKELRGIAADRPVTADELSFVQKARTLALPGEWETAGAVAGSIGEIVKYGLDDHYYDTYAGKVSALTVRDVKEAARVIQVDKFIWVVVGDRAKIEAGVRELNLGPLQLLDPDGNVLAGATK